MSWSDRCWRCRSASPGLAGGTNRRARSYSSVAATLRYLVRVAALRRHVVFDESLLLAAVVVAAALGVWCAVHEGFRAAFALMASAWVMPGPLIGLGLKSTIDGLVDPHGIARIGNGP